MNGNSLWAKYSMLKAMLLVKENMNIKNFPKIVAFLKKCSAGHQPIQSKVLTRQEINLFLKKAPDADYLLVKVIAMIGIAGGCRREELYSMALNDIQDTGTQLIVTIPQTKTNVKRVFTIINEIEGINFLEIYRRYLALRPKNFQDDCLFVGYRNGRCIQQRVGIHTVGAMPKKIAEYLKLENPEKYTGHCFRRTSATLLANAGVDSSVLKRHGGWKSSAVAEKYVEDAIEGKTKIARMIQGGENFVQVLQQDKNTEINAVISNGNGLCTSGININNNSNCTITINFNK